MSSDSIKRAAPTKLKEPPLSRGKRLLFFSVLALLLLLFAEASLHLFYRASVGRWLWEWWAVPIYEADPVRVYRLKSNLDYVHRTREFTARYRTDALGLRTDGLAPPLTMAKSNDVFRVLALGPSFTFGWGVDYEDAFIHQIARGLRVPGKRVELINLGTPSQSIPFQLKWLRETGHLYQPDLILQTAYGDLGSMECDDVLPLSLPYVKDGYLHMQEETWLKKARLRSATLFYGWHVYHSAIGARGDSAGDGRELYRKETAATDAAALDRFRKYISFVHNATPNKPTVVFLNIPLAYTVRPTDRSRVSRPVDVNEARVHAAHITALLQSQGIIVINPLETLLEKDKAVRMYNLYDIHFTREGNKVTAEYALPRLQEIVSRRQSAGK